MTEIPIPAGPTNRELIDLAYLGLAMSDAMFGRTPEEYASAGVLLRAMMAEWPFNLLGFIQEDGAGLRIEEESGIPRQYAQAVALSLAERLAPAIGKSMAPEARKRLARSFSLLCGAVATIPEAQYADATVMGSGHRRFRYGRTYFPQAE